MPKRSPLPATEIEAFDREARAVELRSQGHGFQAIAEALGYADASGASKAYHRALKRRPAQNVDQLREQEAERLEYMWRKTAEVIERPPPVHSAIGKVVMYPGTDDPVPDESVKIRAIETYRKLSESYRKLTALDLVDTMSAEQNAEVTELVAWATKAVHDHDRLTAENRQLRDELAACQRGDIVDAVVVTDDVIRLERENRTLRDQLSAALRTYPS